MRIKMLTHVIVSTYILASAFASFVPNSCLNGGTYIADTKTKGVVCKCAPGWDGPNCSTPFRYLGCYDDKTSIMDVRYPDSTSNSPLECASRCRDYNFAGVQFGKWCFCGNKLRLPLVKKPESECNLKCPGDKQKKCGGNLRISVYSNRDCSFTGDLENPQNGAVFIKGTSQSSVATYTCSAGFKLSGVSTRTCALESGWSDVAPTCVAAIALFIAHILNVVVAGPPTAQATAPMLIAELEINGWNLVFRATSGNGKNVYSAWMTGQNASTTKPIDMSRSYTSHFRQENLNAIWASLNAKYVKFALYRDNREVGYVIFDAQGSNFSNWFANGRVVDASWSDLTKIATYNFFSIVGHVQAHVERRFFINNLYNNCPGDIGHVAVIEMEGPCNMDKHPRYPQFIYADLNSADMWDKQQFGRADYMAIFVSN